MVIASSWQVGAGANGRSGAVRHVRFVPSARRNPEPSRTD
ncbi:hypothetical protein GZL_07746 [Streptomyces sp. 769]|nr:hypothetical protein GZL_07746 [Streptomyces sp. 769]